MSCRFAPSKRVIPDRLPRRLAEDVASFPLADGMRLYGFAREGLRAGYGLLDVNFGSLDIRCRLGDGTLRPVPPGTAHFLEHRMFDKGSGDLGDRFADLGAEVNAYTSFCNTAYHFSCTDNFAANLTLLIGMAERPHLAPEAVARERAIIASELRQYGDDTEWNVFLAALQSAYGDHPLSCDILGTEQSLKQIDAAVLGACYDAFYHTAHMNLFVAGDLCLEEVAAAAGAQIRPGAAVAQAEHRRLLAVPLPACAPVHRSLAVGRPRLCLIFPQRGPALGGRQLLKRELALELLLDILFGPASDFYHRHYRSGLIDADSFGYEVHLGPTYGFCVIGGETPSPARLEEEVCRALDAASAAAAVESAFARSLRKAYGHLIQRFDQIESCVTWMQRAVEVGCQPADLFEVYRAVRPQDLSEGLATCLNPAAYGVGVVVGHRD